MVLILYKNTNGNDPFELFPFRRFLNFFADGVRLRLSWPVVLSSASCLRIRLIIINPSLSVSAFYSFILRLSLQSSLRSTFPDGVFLQNTVWNISCDQYFTCMEHIDFSAFLLPGIVYETCVSFFSRSSTQPSNERPAFYPVD
jgi:hypothetical protein